MSSCNVFAEAYWVVSPSFYSYRHQHIYHLVNDVVGSCTCGTIVSVAVMVFVMRGKAKYQNRSFVHVYSYPSGFATGMM